MERTLHTRPCAVPPIPRANKGPGLGLRPRADRLRGGVPARKVEIPGPPIPRGIITNVPAGAFSIPLDLNHALRETVALQG